MPDVWDPQPFRWPDASGTMASLFPVDRLIVGRLPEIVTRAAIHSMRRVRGFHIPARLSPSQSPCPILGWILSAESALLFRDFLLFEQEICQDQEEKQIPHYVRDDNHQLMTTTN